MRNSVKSEPSPVGCSWGNRHNPRVYSSLFALIPMFFSLFLPCLATPSFAGWTRIGPSGGTILSLAIDPTSSQIVYAGTRGGGIFKTTNGGTGWSAVNTGQAETLVWSLAIDPANTQIVYAGTIDGVFKTTNGGISTASEDGDTGSDHGEIDD